MWTIFKLSLENLLSASIHVNLIKNCFWLWKRILVIFQMIENSNTMCVMH
jgi:hypothetical protein